MQDESERAYQQEFMRHPIQLSTSTPEEDEEMALHAILYPLLPHQASSAQRL